MRLSSVDCPNQVRKNMNRETAGVVSSLSNCQDGIDTHTVHQTWGSILLRTQSGL